MPPDARSSRENSNHIARKRDDVYPLKLELAEYTVEFVPGWWLGTNIANRATLRIITAACDVAKLKFGHDLKISLPNASLGGMSYTALIGTRV
jgi:hypothetical protein